MGSGSGRLRSPARPCLDSGGRFGSCGRDAGECPGSKALSAGGRGRGAHLRPPWEPPSIPQGRWPPPSLGFEPSPSFPGDRAPLFQAGGQRCLLLGRGGRGTSSTLTAEVIFPAPGSGLARHSLPLPRLPERLSFCFFPLWGAFVSSRPE